MSDQPIYTAHDVATLARELRQAAGVDEESFTREKVVSMMRDEVRLLRERGFSDNKIADIFTALDVPVAGAELNDLINKPAWDDDEKS